MGPATHALEGAPKLWAARPQFPCSFEAQPHSLPIVLAHCPQAGSPGRLWSSRACVSFPQEDDWGGIQGTSLEVVWKEGPCLWVADGGTTLHWGLGIPCRGAAPRLGAASKGSTLCSLQSTYQGLKPRRRKQGEKPCSDLLSER